MMRKLSLILFLVSIWGCKGGYRSEVSESALYKIIISSPSTEVLVGEDIVLGSEGIDLQGRAVQVNPIWSCGTNGSLNPTRGPKTVFSALYPGRCIVLAREGKIYASITIDILPEKIDEPRIIPNESGAENAFLDSPLPLKGINIISDRTVLSAGQTVTLVAKGINSRGEIIEINPAWSASEEGILEPETGDVVIFKAIRAGTCVITAQQDDVRATLNIDIRPAQLANLWIEPDYVELESGKEIVLKVKGADREGNEVRINPVWVSTDKGAVIPSTGNSVTFKAIQTGRCMVTTEQEGIIAEAYIDIAPGRLDNLWIEPSYIEVETGRSIILTAKGIDAQGNDVDVNPVWVTIDPLVRLDTNRGKTVTFTRGVAGVCKIEATADTKVATATIWVIPVPMDILPTQ